MDTAAQMIKKIAHLFGLEIRFYHRYEKNRYVWLKRIPIGTIFDIGANTGQFAREFHDHFPNATIYSFEPLHETFRKLVDNCRGIGRHRAFNIALGDSTGTANMNRNVFSPSSSLLAMNAVHREAFPHTASTSVEEIVVKRLDDVIQEEQLAVTSDILIKMDVQGLENKVLMGGKGTFARAAVVITEIAFCELYRGQPLFDDLYRMLTALDFKLAGFIDEGGYAPQTGLPLYTNAIFVKKGQMPA
jgi:FkbM family methyltransferase